MEISFERNIREVERGLSDFARRQIPFAVSLAVNDTAADIEKNTIKRLRRSLDRPTPFTLKAFRIKRASKRRLAASVFAKDNQAEYLKFAESGGARRPKGRAIVVPAGIRLNRYGNMPKGAIQKSLGMSRVFSGVPKGQRNRGPGIYRRTGRGGRVGLRKLAGYVKRASYAPRLGFEDGARKTAAARMPVHFSRSLYKAIRTARR